jgi:hypothetical protein
MANRWIILSLHLGYGGVVERDVVKKGADWFINDFQVISDFLVFFTFSLHTMELIYFSFF